MAENTYRADNSSKNKQRAWLSFKFLEKTFTLDEQTFERGLSVSYIPKFVFMAVLAVFYIANAHFAENMIRKTNKLEIEIENLRADHASLKADYDRLTGKKSEIAETAKKMGLEESKGKIQKIIVKKGEY